ncbi:MAG TPA: hypothetical protein VFH17_05225, partial [Coriobacteriia bacterium]|nr:hypothetical protein [Coriobacteriia bacterium]
MKAYVARPFAASVVVVVNVVGIVSVVVVVSVAGTVVVVVGVVGIVSVVVVVVGSGPFKFGDDLDEPGLHVRGALDFPRVLEDRAHRGISVVLLGGVRPQDTLTERR